MMSPDFIPALSAGDPFIGPSITIVLFLTIPLLRVWDDAALLYTGISDGLMIQFSLATLVALIITVPCLMWNVWAYIAPGLHKNEKMFLIPIFLLSPILFVPNYN